MSRRRRNVLLITVDQWRGDCLSRLGHDVVKTPHLDAFAEEGVQFAAHYCNAVPCGPSRASIHTGMYLANHRSGTNGTPLDRRFTNWALAARSLGYAPALFGYTHTARDPREFDADHPYMRTDEGPLPGMDHVLPMGTDCTPWRDWLAQLGYERLPEDPQYTFLMRDDDPRWEAAGQPRPLAFPAEHSDTRFMVDRLLDWLGEQERGGIADGAPGWMAHLSLVRPHPPWIAPVPYNTLYPIEDLPPPLRAADVNSEGAQHPWLAYQLARPRSAAHADPLRHGLLQASYYGLMSEVDDNLARLFEALKASGAWQDTLIVLTSDHGEQMGDHWLLGKTGYFDQSYHVPMFVRDPDARADATRGRIVEAFTEHVDILPTLLEWMGAPRPRQADGHSLLGWVHDVGAPASWREAVHWEYDFRDPIAGEAEAAFGLDREACHLAVRRTRRWKYVHFAALPPLLFDLEADPGELHNLADDPAAAVALSEEARGLLSWRMTIGDRTLSHMRISRDRGLVVAE
ncbi:MAG: alkaline phosphatase family protein [Gammaproteobacteria bacterium]|nr:alkaline phosphatase family protein [Gammaproteobacteria bacterium]